MAGTGNLILKRGTRIPFGGEDGGQSPILIKGMPAVQLNGLSKSTDGVDAAGPYAYSNYENRLWIGQNGYGTGTSEDFSALGLQPYSLLPPQTEEYTRPMWMGAEIRAFTPIKADSADTYYSILKADWDRPSDYVLCTQQAIAFAPQRIWATGTPIDPQGTPVPIRRYIDWATVDHGNGSSDPWRVGATVHLSKKLVLPVQTPAVGQTLVVAADGVTTVNGVDVITLAWAQSGGGSTLTLNGDSGTAAVANTTETITFTGGDGITTSVAEGSATANTVTISQNINELTAKTPVLADAVAINDSESSNAIKKSTFTNIRDLIRSNLDINSLNAAAITSDDLLIVEESSTVKKTTVGDLVDFIGNVANSDVTVSNTGQTTIGANRVTNAMLATASAAATNSTVAIRDGSGNLVATQFTGPSTLVKGTATTQGSANKILFASSISGNDVTVAYDNAGSPLRYDAANSKLIVQNLEVLGTEQVNTKISASVGAPYLTLNSDYSIYSNVSVGGVTADGTSNSEPVENGRIIVNRGPLSDTELRWNETTEKWELVTTKSYTNALTSIAKNTSGGLTITYNPTGYTRKFQVGEYISISGLTSNKEYNNLWKVATSSYTNPTSASFTVTEKTLRHSQIVITQNTPSTGRTRFTVTHDYTYAIPTGTQTVTITGNTTSALNNTYSGANVSESTSTQLVFDVLTSSYSGLNGTSGTNVASADTNYVTTTANGASAATLSTPTDNLNCKLTGVWAYPLMYADGADSAENNTGEDQIIDKLTVRTLNMAGTWILNSAITTDLNLGSGGLILPQGASSPSNVNDEGRIFWNSSNNLLTVGAGSNASKTFVDTDSTQTLSGKTINSIGAAAQGSNTTIHSQVTTGSIALGGGVTTGSITIGNALTTGTITIGNGTNTSGNKIINIGTGGGSGGTTNITLGSTTTGAAGTTTITGTTLSVPNATSITLGTATAASTVDIGTGATVNASSKTINIGTAGVSGSTTNITLGSAVNGANGTTTINGVTTTITGTTLSASNATAITLGNTTAASTIDIGIGATASGNTKAINIGTAGVSGSTTNITLGSAGSGAGGTTTINSATTTINSTTLSASSATSITLGTATAASTINIGTGATASGNTKAINIGTAGVSGSTTNITLGSAGAGASGTTTINGATTTVSSPTFSASSATSITLGTTTAASSTNIGTGANTSGTKAINIGTGGGNLGTTTITIGSCVAGHTSNVYLGSGLGTSVVQVSNNALIFKDSGVSNRITLSSASTIGASATHTLPNITSGNVVIAGATNFNASNHILMGGNSTTPSVFTDKDTVVVGGVKVNMQNSIATNVRYPIPFLGSNRSTDATDPAAGFTFTEGQYQDSYLYANMAAAGTADGAPTNYTNGLFYEVNDASASNVGTLYCDYIGATLDCGSY